MEKYAKLFMAVIPHNGEDEHGNNLGKVQGYINMWIARKEIVKLPANANGTLRPNPDFNSGPDSTTIICYHWVEPQPVQSNVPEPVTKSVTKPVQEQMPF